MLSDQLEAPLWFVSACRQAWASAPGFCLAAALAVFGGGAQLDQARAADVQIVVSPMIQVPVGSENLLPIELTQHGTVPGRCIVLIRGLPSAVSLSKGRLFESGVWGVPVGELDGLRLITGSAAFGRTAFAVSLVTLTGDVLGEADSSLVVSQTSQMVQTTAAVQETNPVREQLPDGDPASRRPPPLSPKALENIKLFMGKGDNAMQASNINLARLFYTQAAEAGSAEGAYALAATYDPAELARLRVMGGIQPDPTLAKRWYEKATELGSQTAQSRLTQLGQR